MMNEIRARIEGIPFRCKQVIQTGGKAVKPYTCGKNR